MIRIPILRAGSRETFPHVDSALAEPNGLLAAGGDLSPSRLLEAYRHGIFPWFSHGEPILWWSPDPRMVFATGRVHVSTKLRRWLRRCEWTIAADRDFSGVMRACAAPRPRQPTTWITPSMQIAYEKLHALGHAHSIEVYDAGELVGGIYGVAVGRMFFGESMFSGRSNGSKVALLALCAGLHAWDFALMDAQVRSPHLESMGAFEMPRRQFIAHVERTCALSAPRESWAEHWCAITPATLAAASERPASA
ncbi:MAG TPA: leucyl/phenylalanyl-tRNA--protein transferase [Rudaea sp.]